MTEWAVVLGSSVGTGAAVARAVAEAPGLNVFGVHRNHYPADAASVASDVNKHGKRAQMHIADAGALDNIASCAEEIERTAGKHSVKLFVHSIACASLGPLVTPGANRVSPRQVQRTFDAMTHSFVYWTQELLDHDLLAPGARLVGFSNLMVDSYVRHAGLIAASKLALEGYVRHLAFELGPRGHTVNLVKFGAVWTRAAERTFDDASIDRLSKSVADRVPAGRGVTVEEVARLVGLLMRDEARWFNGAIIDFTGAEGLGLLDALSYPR